MIISIASSARALTNSQAANGRLMRLVEFFPNQLGGFDNQRDHSYNDGDHQSEVQREVHALDYRLHLRRVAIDRHEQVGRGGQNAESHESQSSDHKSNDALSPPIWSRNHDSAA